MRDIGGTPIHIEGIYQGQEKNLDPINALNDLEGILFEADAYTYNSFKACGISQVYR